MFEIYEATDNDVDGIRNLFVAAYGKEYPYSQFYDLQELKKMCFDEETLVLVCREKETKKIIGTASVVMDTGAYSDLVGEFGRLVVHPEYTGQKIAKQLVKERIKYVQDRLHVAIIDARTAHCYSQKSAEKNKFVVVGFLPQYLIVFQRRESISVLVRYFGIALELRRNHPRIIPELYHLACLAFRNLHLPFDAIIDEESIAYTCNKNFSLQELTTEGYANLLRLQRGRLKNREIFGPLRLHYGFFKLNAKNATYLIAKELEQFVGAIGFIVDPIDKIVKVFELINTNNKVIPFLFIELEKKCKELGLEYIEVDVSAYSSRMQKTLLELNYLPTAYIPAYAFHDVERLDIIKMVRLLVPFNLGLCSLTPTGQIMADIVSEQFAKQSSITIVHHFLDKIFLFSTLTKEQLQRITLICNIKLFHASQNIFIQGEIEHELLIILEGKVQVLKDEKVVGYIEQGECLGEMSLIFKESHSATAVAKTNVKTLVLKHNDIIELTEQRPDISAIVYQNLGVNLAEKLKRLDSALENII